MWIFLNDMREEILALKELDKAKIRCDIPSLHSSLTAKNTVHYNGIVLNHWEKVS